MEEFCHFVAGVVFDAFCFAFDIFFLAFALLPEMRQFAAASKGGAFLEAVLILGDNNAFGFNDQRAFDEEQRRLFYVGITRTRQTLVLSSFRQMDAALAHQLQVPLPAQRRRVINTITSPFINELGPNCPRPMSGQQFLLTLG